MPTITLDYADRIAAEVGFFAYGLDPALVERIMEFGATCAERGYQSGYAAGSSS